MPNENEQPKAINSDVAQLQADVRRVVEGGLNVQEQVRQLTLRKMSAGQFDLASLREMVQAVINGARAGVQPAEAKAELTRSHLQQVIAGLDAALAQLAQASKLALQEAAGRAQAFSRDDLARAHADLQGLESLLLDTLQASAASAKDVASQILSDLATHVRHSGSAVGAQLQDTLGIINQQLAEVGRSQLQAGLHLAQATDLLRQLTAGVLIGLADRVKPGPRAGQE